MTEAGLDPARSVAAIRTAGLNRARIRDAIFALDTFPGVTGTIVFDTNMDDIGPPWLAVVEHGRLRYFSSDHPRFRQPDAP